jgi:hypothetical protein
MAPVTTDNVYVRLVILITPSAVPMHKFSSQSNSKQKCEHLTSPIYHLAHTMSYVSMD